MMSVFQQRGAVCHGLILMSIAMAGPPQIRDTPRAEQSGTALISGRVVTDDGAAQPIRRASVLVVADDGSTRRSVTTDDRGGFAFAPLPPGRYYLEASKLPFIKGAFGAPRPGRTGSAVVLAKGQRVTDVIIRLTRGSAISGTIRDANGRPAEGVLITASTFVFVDGERVLKTAGSAGAITDSQGTYRIYALPPGEYVVAAAGNPVFRRDEGIRAIEPGEVKRVVDAARTGTTFQRSGESTRARPSTIGQPRLFYPGNADPGDAAILRLSAGEQLDNIDMQMTIVRTYDVVGDVLTPNGGPAPSVLMTATPIVSSAFGGVIADLVQTGRTNETGRFAIAGLVPGRYALSVIAKGPPFLWAATEISIAGGDVTASLRLARGIAVSGRIVFDGRSNVAPQAAALRIGLRDAAKSSAPVIPVQVAANGTFTVGELVPGRYVVVQTDSAAGRQWYLRSAKVGETDVLEPSLEIRAGMDVQGLVLTLTDRPSQLVGTLEDASGRPASDYFIVVFAADRERWIPGGARVRQTRPATDGTYVVKNLPAGEYFVAALTDVQPGEWNAPSFLEQLIPLAVRTTVADGETTVQLLRLKRDVGEVQFNR